MTGSSLESTQVTENARSTPRISPTRDAGSPRHSPRRGSDKGLVSQPSTALKPRPSRWADEVEEDDQFVPIKSEFARRPPVVVKEEPPVISVKSTGRPIPERRTPRNKPVAAPVRPSADEIEEISHMKEVMTRKAEERKKQKEEEEARLEAERKARCLAKLREIEERQKSKSSSVVSSPAVTPSVPVVVKAAVAEPFSVKPAGPAPSSVKPAPARAPTIAPVVSSVAAPVVTPVVAAPIGPIVPSPQAILFNRKRRELRTQRDNDRRGDERVEIISISSQSSSVPNTPPPAVPSSHPVNLSALSAGAAEFVPHHSNPMMQPQHPPPQWMMHHQMGGPPMHMQPTPYGYPQYPQYPYPPQPQFY